MNQMELEVPYEGTEPYVFMSYCHKDLARIAPVLRALQKQGCRVWYDQGIAPGEEWPETIANHLEKSRVFLAFLSRASMDSHNCRREFNFAMMENKPSLIVFLEQMELTPVMKMQLSTVQAVRLDEDGAASDCAGKLLALPEAQECIEDEATVVIPREKRKQYYLRRRATGETIRITGEEFRVGRSKSLAEDGYVISGNNTVSKIHAVFYRSADGCAVMDNHSTNGVYVNDDQIPAGERRLLSRGDLIEIGSEQFVFELEEDPA